MLQNNHRTCLWLCSRQGKKQKLNPTVIAVSVIERLSMSVNRGFAIINPPPVDLLPTLSQGDNIVVTMWLQPCYNLGNKINQ